MFLVMTSKEIYNGNFFQRYGSFNPIWRVEWHRDLISCKTPLFLPRWQNSKNRVMCPKKNEKLEFKQDMSGMVFVFQKCYNDVYTKSFDFFVEQAGKILQALLFHPQKRSFRQIALATFASIFGRPPISAPIHLN